MLPAFESCLITVVAKPSGFVTVCIADAACSVFSESAPAVLIVILVVPLATNPEVVNAPVVTAKADSASRVAPPVTYAPYSSSPPIKSCPGAVERFFAAVLPMSPARLFCPFQQLSVAHGT